MRLNGSGIRERRQAKGWSLRKLAQESGVSFGYIASMERGKNHSPSYEAITKIASALEVPVSYFFDNTVSPVTQPTEETA